MKRNVRNVIHLVLLVLVQDMINVQEKSVHLIKFIKKSLTLRHHAFQKKVISVNIVHQMNHPVLKNPVKNVMKFVRHVSKEETMTVKLVMTLPLLLEKKLME